MQVDIDYGRVRADGTILLKDLHRDYQRIRQTVPQRVFLSQNGLQHTNSSCISAVGKKDDDTLIIRFHSGSVYKYPNMADKHYDKLLAANSRGRYFNKKIRPTKNYIKVGTLPFPNDMAQTNIPKLTDDDIFKSLDNQALKDVIRAYPNAVINVNDFVANGQVFNELLLDLLKVYVIKSN